MSIKVDVVTAEKLVFSDDVDVVVAPGIEGELGILPRHESLMTILRPGELRIRKGTEETSLAVTGGFLEVQPNHITVLADAAERADEIDLARAEAAKKRAEDRLSHKTDEVDAARAEAALQRSMIRIRIAEKVARRQRPSV